MPEMLIDVSWPQIKKEIQEAHLAYMSSLLGLDVPNLVLPFSRKQIQTAKMLIWLP